MLDTSKLDKATSISNVKLVNAIIESTTGTKSVQNNAESGLYTANVMKRFVHVCCEERNGTSCMCVRLIVVVGGIAVLGLGLGLEYGVRSLSLSTLS